jgi:alginate O-acetyltransferase complex protein AlgJ
MPGARLQGWAMIIVLVGGFGLGIAALLRPGPQLQLAQVMTLDAFLAGRTAGAVNHVMAHDLPIGPVLQAAGGELRWQVFDGGGPQVAVGCDDWLYLMEELRPWPGYAQAMAARADALHRVAAALTARGIALEVVLVPDKARIETGPACGVPYSAQSRGRLAAFKALLGGLPVVDLAPVFASSQVPVYYRTDTHWNQFGAALAARTAAAAVHAPITRDRVFKTEAGPEADRVGDLLRLMSLDDVPNTVPGLPIKLRPAPDRERPETTTQTEGPADTGGLLDDAPVPEVVLLGSSFSLNGNFHGHLQEALGAAVGQFGQAGGAFWGSARDYFRSPAFTETPPKLVIWEIPERVVDQPIEADEAAFLKAGVGG